MIQWKSKSGRELLVNVNRGEEGVTYLTFPLLEQHGVKHGFATRLGGVSKGYCQSMNLSFDRGDDRKAVLENHRLFARAVGYDEKNLVLSNQIHETVVRRVDSSDCGKGIFRESDLIGVDGLMTDEEDVVLMIFGADCVPLFFYDKKNKAVAACHSGWRGTVARIGAVTIERMREGFGTLPEDIIAVVGPSICQNCYEVSGDVAEKFREELFKEEFPCKYWDEMFFQSPEQKREDKYQLDLWRANEIILRESGIPGEQIQVCGLCTCCNPELLFSHRALGGKRGNLAGVISL